MFKIKDNYIYRQCVNDSILIEKLNENNLEIFFDSKIFQEMLMVANPRFFNELTKEKIYQNSTFRNYAKRSLTRATPFGLFSSVGVGSFSKVSYPQQIRENYSKKVSVSGEWISSLCMMLENEDSVLLQLHLQWNQKVLELSDKYQLNNINYWGVSEQSRDILIKKTALLEFIKKLTYKSEVSVLDLVQEIQTKSPNLETQKIIDYLRNLIISEFLFTNLRKVVINHNCLDNLIYILSSINEQTKLTTDLLQLKSCIEKYSKSELGEGILQYAEICEKMSHIFNEEKQRYLKVDLVNSYDSLLPKDLKKTLEDFVNFISRINLGKDYRNKELISYTEKFVEKYGEYVEVPIKQLLDSKLGLGIPKQNLEPYSILSSVAEQTFLSYLSKEIFKAVKNNKKEIDISNIPPELLYPNLDRFAVNQFELYCEMKNFGEQPVISIVPNTGSDMIGKSIGRFASYFLNSNIELDSRVDNVELIEFPSDNKNLNVMSSHHGHSKKLLLSYEDDFDIDSLELDFLVVGVERVNEHYKLYFRDLRTDLIVNFVTTSMLNHKSIGVFSHLARFLLTVSLEWQDNPFSLFRVIENLDFLPYIPRIKYKNIILSEEKWILSDVDKKDMSTISQWKKFFDVPSLLYFHKDDERLLIDLKNSLDVQWILKQNVDKLHFTRFDKIDGKNCEFIFGFENPRNSVYPHSVSEKTVRRIENDFYKDYVKTFSSDWIYFKLYGINSSTMPELRENLLIFTDELLAEKLVSDFHFVNYNDGGDGSIRLRFKIMNEDDFKKLRYRIIHWIDFLLNHYFCKDVSFNLYEREVERYGGIGFLTVCERIFSIDSYLVLKLFSKKVLKVDDYLSVLHSIFIYIRLLGISPKQLLKLMKDTFTQNIYRKSFKKVFPNNAKVIKEFKQYFEDQSKFDIFNEVFKSFSPIEKHFEYKNDMIHSLLHMHMNRIGIFSLNEKEYLYFVRYILEVLNNYEKYN
ncbi:TPA: thiopeptide-type bacteriocin biosynthesis protein [Streptococcus pneumoniae]|uniref:lantibiotic dehydratase n=1 Tax=Streptococcus pneumoniae TaxID=1313 RepID=UPI00295A2F53|nr:lantibiotic dehydratase [Streptococcus pneumoniae]MDV8224711.1 lantibiotic dehydratase [Streptococcus pneumoniae]MDV8242501.1 lantibiotic dehydratase [Streptococcus pneumoniae]MDV8329035.1 lantibiotic dehydratase [Streptococcus pneumoniae]MDV8507443.1 lantibiotic dehydratase [Streptococcus pneumoniae]